MTADSQVRVDTRDMHSVHHSIKRGLNDAPGQVASVADGDRERAQRLADYLADLLWLLHAHHASEDALLYPLLIERLPEHRELFLRMDAQHAAVTAGTEEAQRDVARFRASATEADGRALARSCTSLLEVLAEHLGQEEEQVLPLVPGVISVPEWAALPGHALSQYRGARMWLPLGLVIEAMPEEMSAALGKQLPPPVANMWFGGGADAFTAEMAAVRGGTA